MNTSTKTSLSTKLSAIADDLRLRASKLLEAEELTVGELASVLQLPQSTASRHLKTLASAGWIRARQAGTSTLYSLTLDDLNIADRAVWVALREQLVDEPGVVEDARRLRAVLDARKTDSIGYFGRVAGEWDEVRNELFGSGFTAPALLAMIPSDWAVADLGCGTGNASAFLAPHVREVFAIDQSGPMLESAAKRLEAFVNVRFIEGRLDAIPLDDSSVDATVSILVLHHLDDLEAMFREMRRITRSGGTALVVDMFEIGRASCRERV